MSGLNGSSRPKELTTTVQVRLYPTPEQAALLRAHCHEYISTINVLVQAIDAEILPEQASTKDFISALPSAVKNQALRDARSVWKRSLELGRIPILRKPICQWNNQNWRRENNIIILPCCINGTVKQQAIRCAAIALPAGEPGLLRVKRKRGKWLAQIAITLPTPEPTTGQAIMGVDLGIKVPAVVHILGKGSRFFGNGRQQRAKRRQCFSQRRSLQQAGKTLVVKAREDKEARWMREVNHKLSRQIVTHAQQQGVGIIRLEQLQGIRHRITQLTTKQTTNNTASTSRRANEQKNEQKQARTRKNNRMKNTWSFYQLAEFITYKAERAGIRVERVNPAYTSQRCPACGTCNKAEDRVYVCSECGWYGHRDRVGAINVAKQLPDTGVRGHSGRATGATTALPVDGPPETALSS